MKNEKKKRKLTEYNKYIKKKILDGYDLSKAIEEWYKYKKTKKGSRSTNKKRSTNSSRKNMKTHRKRRVGSRSKRKSR